MRHLPIGACVDVQYAGWVERGDPNAPAKAPNKGRLVEREERPDPGLQWPAHERTNLFLDAIGADIPSGFPQPL